MCQADSEFTNPEAVWRAEVELLLDVFRSSSTQPVEDVIVPLLLALRADTGLFQQVMGHETTYYCILENKSALYSNQHVTS